MEYRESHQIHLVDAKAELSGIEQIYRSYLDPSILAEYNHYVMTRNPKDVITYFSADYVKKAITLLLYESTGSYRERDYKYNDALIYITNGKIRGHNFITELSGNVELLPHETIYYYLNHISNVDLTLLEKYITNLSTRIDKIVEYWPNCLYKVDVISSGVVVVEKGEEIHQYRYKEVCEYLETQRRLENGNSDI